MEADLNPFGYRIHPVADGWRWVVFQDESILVAQGLAATRPLAAAYVIRAIMRVENSAATSEAA